MTPDPYGFNSGLPPEIAAEAQALARRQKMAELMMQQAQQPPQEPVVKGRFNVPISPLAGVGKLAQAYFAGQQLKDSDKAMAGLGTKYQTGQAEALTNYMKVKQGTPGTSENIIDEQANEGEGAPATISAPGVPGDPRKAITDAMMNPYLAKNPMIAAEAKSLQPTVLGRSMVIPATGEVTATDSTWKAEQEAARDARVEAAKVAAQQRTDDLRERIAATERAGQSAEVLKRELAANQIQARREIAALTAAARPPVPVTPVTIQDPNDPNKTVVIDGRTRQVLGAGPKDSATGAVDRKLTAALPQAKLRVESMTQNLDKLDTAIDELNKDPGLPNITGTLAGRTPNLTNTATGAQAKLDSIKSQIFVSALQSMREASKTGGAVGNVSDREGDKLENTLAALSQAQGTDAFRVQLKKAREQVRLSRELINKAFDEQYGSVQQETPNRRATDTNDPLGIRK